MRDIVLMSDSATAHRFLRDLWRTDRFRRSHDDPNGFVNRAVESFARVPAFFFELSDASSELPHFSTWWGGIQLREQHYENAAIHDLYYLHEIYHRGAMPYATGLNFQSFQMKMTRNELEASVCSEIAVYFALPGLRSLSFPHPIYADRFLADGACHAAWAEDPDRLTEKFRVLRYSVMQTQEPRDDAEFWIRQYAQQNDAWASVWVHRYDEIEAAMVWLESECRAGRRGASLERHIEWLLSFEVAEGGDIPFPEQARAFSGLYWLNKKEFKRMAERQRATPVAARSA